MSDENKIREAADAVKGILEAVPVYQDVVQPAALQLGKGLETVAKLVQVALAPVSLVVWGYDQIRDYLEATLAGKLKDVPPDHITQPRMTIAGPIVEQLRFAADEPTLRELYAKLLATSMDARTAEEAHPAFVDIVRQLSSDEARVLRFIVSSYAHGMMLFYGCLYLSARANNDEPPSRKITRTNWSSESETKGTPCLEVDPSNTLAIASDCDCPHLIQTYLDNLRRLGLLSIEDEAGNTGLDVSSLEMRDEEYVWGAIKRYAQEMGLSEPIEVYFQGTTDIVTFTALGRQFCRACVIDGTHGPEDAAYGQNS